MEDEQIRRRRHALQSQIDVLAAAQRRLAEIDDDLDHNTHEPAAAHDDGHLAVADGSLLLQRSRDPSVPPPVVASGDPDDLYYYIPLLSAPFDAMQLDHHDAQDGTRSTLLLHGATDDIISLDHVPQAAATSALNAELELAWDDVVLDSPLVYGDYGSFYDSFDQQHPTDQEAAGGDDHLSGLPIYDGDMLPQQFTTSSDDGFGGVPASAAAIAGLQKQRHGGGPDDDTCVICMREYKKGKKLYVMPCAFKHRFHRKCLNKWLNRSHLCPLCRHALPTDDDTPASSMGKIETAVKKYTSAPIKTASF